MYYLLLVVQMLLLIFEGFFMGIDIFSPSLCDVFNWNILLSKTLRVNYRPL